MKRLLLYFIAIAMTLCLEAKQKQDTLYIDDLSSVHLIFPSNVIKADLGSGIYLDADGNEVSDVAMVRSDKRLKVTAMVKEFPSTNLFVETERAYYSFILVFSYGQKKYIEPVMFDDAIVKKTRTALSEEEVDGTKVEIKKETGFELLCESIMSKEGEIIQGEVSDKVGVWVDGIFIDQKSEYMYISLNVLNEGNIAYHWDYTGFFIRNKGNKSIKDEVVLDEEYEVIYEYNKDLTEVKGGETVRKVFVFKKVTIDKDKVFSIEVWENDGDRKTILEMKSKDLLNADIVG